MTTRVALRAGRWAGNAPGRARSGRGVGGVQRGRGCTRAAAPSRAHREPPAPNIFRPFADSSPWNTPIPAGVALRPDSATLVQHLAESSEWPGLSVSIHPWSVPVYWVNASTPLVDVHTPLEQRGREPHAALARAGGRAGGSRGRRTPHAGGRDSRPRLRLLSRAPARRRRLGLHAVLERGPARQRRAPPQGRPHRVVRLARLARLWLPIDGRAHHGGRAARRRDPPRAGAGLPRPSPALVRVARQHGAPGQRHHLRERGRALRRPPAAGPHAGRGHAGPLASGAHHRARAAGVRRLRGRLLGLHQRVRRRVARRARGLRFGVLESGSTAGLVVSRLRVVEWGTLTPDG
jgi:hypothetical protein